jgi:protein-S-isoprenylcysteine O-methyltransferase Ste14
MLWAIGGSWGIHPKLLAEHQFIKHGPYRFIRNPLYTGLHLVYLGTFLLVPSWYFLVLLIAAIIGNSIRAGVEERVLLARYQDEYAAYAQSVGRFFPKLMRRSE